MGVVHAELCNYALPKSLYFAESAMLVCGKTGHFHILPSLTKSELDSVCMH